MGEQNQNYSIDVEDSKRSTNRNILVWLLFISFGVFGIANLLGDSPFFVMSQDSFIIIHIVLYFLTIAMVFSIFTITYNIFKKTKSLDLIIIACVFLAFFIMSLFRIFTYKDMMSFPIPTTVENSIVFWIIPRLIISLGIFAACLIPSTKRLNKKPFICISFTGLLALGICSLVIFQRNLFYLGKISKNSLSQIKTILEYIIVALLIGATLIYYRRYLSEKNRKAYLFLVIGLLFNTIGNLAYIIFSSLFDIANLLGHFYNCIAYYVYLRGLFILNIQTPYEDLSIAQAELNNYVENLKKTVALKRTEVAVANEKIIKNLQDAKHIQMALMVMDFPKVTGMEFAAKYLPCEQVGGDFYNVFRLDEENIGIVIGDVAGHGVSAAMVNVFINQNMRFRVDYDDNRYRILTPRGVLMNLYHVYNNMNFPEEIYVVLLYGIYNIKTGIFSYASAGMNTYPIILGANGQVSFLELGGFPICKFGEFFKPSYETKTIPLAPGDTLIFYSDGLGEIDRSRPEIFSPIKIKEFLAGLRNISAQEICDELFDAYNALLAGKEMLDDVTILVVQTPESTEDK